MSKRAQNLIDKLLEHALSLPETWEDDPWGGLVVKAGKKIFLSFGADDAGRLAFSVKLPDSGTDLLEMPFAEPTAYGLGKCGWVTMRFEPGSERAIAEMRRWVEESYRAVALKRLLKELDSMPGRAAGRRPNP